MISITLEEQYCPCIETWRNKKKAALPVPGTFSQASRSKGVSKFLQRVEVLYNFDRDECFIGAVFPSIDWDTRTSGHGTAAIFVEAGHVIGAVVVGVTELTG